MSRRTAYKLPNKRSKGKYNYELMARVYLEGNYTIKDLEYIFGAVNGGISKKFEAMGIPTKKRDLSVNQRSPKSFSKELREGLISESKWALENRGIKVNYLQRIDEYYKRVCFMAKLVEINNYYQNGLNPEEISAKYDRMNVGAVEDILKKFKMSEDNVKKAREVVRKYVSEYQVTSQQLRDA